MKVHVKTVKDDLYKMERAATEIEGKKVNVGVLGGENAWLAAIHEYGCKIKVTPKMRAYLHRQGLHLKKTTEFITIPERSFLRSGFDKNNPAVLKNIERTMPLVLEGKMSVKQYCDTIGLLLSSKIKTYARDLREPPNHPFTIDQKGSSNPLVGTGTMIESITYEVE